MRQNELLTGQNRNHLDRQNFHPVKIVITKPIGNPGQEHPTSSWKIRLIRSVSSHEKGAAGWERLADVRKEQCAGIGVGAVLAEEPQIVESGGILFWAIVDYRHPFLNQLESLVHKAVSVAQIHRLRLADVGPTGEN